MAHSGAGGSHPSAHPPMGPAMAAAIAANGLVPPLPPHSGSGFTPGALPSTSSSAVANAHLLALTQNAGLLQTPPLAQHMFGIRGMAPGNLASVALSNLNSRDESRRSGERSSSGEMHKIISESLPSKLPFLKYWSSIFCFSMPVRRFT